MAAIKSLDNIFGEETTRRNTPEDKPAVGTCDSCGIKASYRATKQKSCLNFCGHHARKNASSLLETGFVISPGDYIFDLTK